MNLDKLIKIQYAPESAEQIRALEKQLGVIFPPLLKQIYAMSDEAHIGPIRTVTDPALHFDFHAVREPHSEWVGSSVASAHKRIVSQYPTLSRVIPIGAPGNGDQVCLDYRQPAPSVVMFNHEIAYRTAEAFHPLARDFEELIAAVYRET